MPICEDYPCCGHGPAPLGDGGGCPDEEGRYPCVFCGARLPKGHPRASCDGCASRQAWRQSEQNDQED